MNKKLSLLLLCGAMTIPCNLKAQQENSNNVSEKIKVDKMFGLLKNETTDLSEGSVKRLVPQMPNRMNIHSSARKLMRHKLQSKAGSHIYEPGWSVGFDTQDEWNQFTIINANNDEVKGANWNYGVWNYFFNQNNGAALYYYSKDKNADDWLITPGLNLKAGKTYYVRFKLKCVQATYVEKIEINYGNAATAEAMTSVVMPATEISSTAYQEYTREIKPNSDGVFYIGFHAISPAFKIGLYVDDISVVAAPEPQSPNVVTEVKATPDATAALKATLSFKAPSTSFDGKNLSSISGVKIFNGGKIITDIKNVSTGQLVSYTDEHVEKDGMNVYTITPYNEYNDGPATTVSVFVGLDLPASPENAKLSNDPDKVVLTWDASKGAHNGAFFPEKVNYDIYTISYDNYGSPTLQKKVASVADGKTSYTPGFGADHGIPGEVVFGLVGVNATGQSEKATLSNTILVGSPNPVPYKEGFANGKEKNILQPFGEGVGVSYGMAGAGRLTEEDANGDGGCAYIQTFMKDSVGMRTFKIALTGSHQPKLVFSRKSTAKSGIFRVYVITPDGKMNILETTDFSATSEEGWKTKKFDLSKFVGERYILVGFSLANNNEQPSEQRVLIDNINVGEVPATDASVNVSAQAKIDRGAETAFNVLVNNNGDSDIASYRLKLSVGDKLIADSIINEVLPSFGYKKLAIAYKSDFLNTENSFKVVATVIAGGDVVADNNESSAEVKLISAEVSPIENLNLSKSKDADNKLNVALSWDKPSPLVGRTEDFESFTNWKYNDLTPWTLVDGDSAITGGGIVYGSNGEVKYENQGTPFAYIVFNPHNFGGLDLPTGNITKYNAHSGNQFLVSMYGYVQDKTVESGFRNVQNNDWIISPELPAKAQTISFFINNIIHEDKDVSATYEVLYSTTTADTASFKTIDGQRISATGGVWKQVSVDLPEGSKYFAIRNVTPADKGFVFMIDDINYHVNGGVVDKYKVYRDGVLIGDTKEPKFNDMAVPEGNHLYQVTAYYVDGRESIPVSVSLVVTGLETIVGTDEPFDIYTLDGICVKRGATTLNGLSSGVYVAKGKKIVVR